MMAWSALLPARLRRRADIWRHERAIRGILHTPPIVPRDDGVVLFSMIGTGVLLPYLVAVKSLHAQLRRGRIAILDDGTLTEADRATLAHHCGVPEIIALADVATGPFPHGGCWERLLTILDRPAGEYWLQLDSDTVTLGPVDEVASAIAAGRSFTMLGGIDAELGALPLAEFAARRWPGGPEGGHVQARIESRMGRIGARHPDWRYIRGCAGFAGFAAGAPARPLAAAFLAEMAAQLDAGDTGLWGTEQVASNFLIANAPDPVLLPSARYPNFWGSPLGDAPAFVHFVGAHRHDLGAYRAASRRAIAMLAG